MYKCPYCCRFFAQAEKQRCPHCSRVVLTADFFKARPRRADGPTNPAPLAAERRRKARTKGPLSYLRHEGLKAAIVLAVLMLVGVALLSKARTAPPNARSNSRKIESTRMSLAALRVALELYKADRGSYPDATQGLSALTQPPVPGNGWKGPYVDELKNDLWGMPFQYEPNAGSRALFGCGPDRIPGTRDDIAIAQSDITLNPGEGTVYAVIVFRDGSRKIIREKVVAEERAIPAELSTPPPAP